MNRVSLSDVAKRAGVSRMTVSYALRNSPEVSEGVRSRVQSLAEEMGYKPDPVLQRFAVHLRSRKTTQAGTIAYLIADRAAQKFSIYKTFLLSARQRAESFGYRLEEFWTKEKGMTGLRLSRILEHRGIEGIVIGPVSAPMGHLRLDWSKFAVAAIGHSMVRPLVHRAANHQLHSGREAFRQLQRLGYRRIGLCIEYAQNQRVDNGYEYALLAYHERIAAKDRVPPLWLETYASPPFRRWLKQEKPDCIVGIGQWVYRQLLTAGYRVPEDIGVALLDWTVISGELAGIDQRPDQVGAAAVDLVVGQLFRNERGLPDAPRMLLIEGRWHPGSSAITRNKSAQVRQRSAR